MARHRSWYAAVGSVATAAVIGIVAYVTEVASDPGAQLGPTGRDSPRAIATDTAAGQRRTHDGDQRRTVTVYYLGRDGQGDDLVPQPTPVRPGTSAIATAVAALSTDPYDPDHRAGWQPGWLVSAQVSDGVVTLELGSAPASRPAHMSARTAYETVQAAIYTLQAAGRTGVPVRFVRHGRATSTVLGVSTAQPLTAARAWDVVSPVAITRPATERGRVHGRTLVVAGVATAPNGTTIRLELVRRTSGHARVVLRKSLRVEAPADADQPATWHTTFATARLAPGRYMLRASTSDFPADRPATDTRVVVLLR
jgi:hypothetical protein